MKSFKFFFAFVLAFSVQGFALVAQAQSESFNNPLVQLTQSESCLNPMADQYAEEMNSAALRGCISSASCGYKEQCVNNQCQPIAGGFGCSSDYDCTFPNKCIDRVCR